MSAEPVSPAVPPKVRVQPPEWPGLQLAREGWGFTFSVSVWELKMKRHSSWWLLAVPLPKPRHGPPLSAVVGPEGRRGGCRRSPDNPCLPPPRWRTMLCDQGCAPHFPPFQFPSCVPAAGMWVWAELGMGFSCSVSVTSSRAGHCLNRLGRLYWNSSIII